MIVSLPAAVINSNNHYCSPFTTVHCWYRISQHHHTNPIVYKYYAVALASTTSLIYDIVYTQLHTLHAKKHDR